MVKKAAWKQQADKLSKALSRIVRASLELRGWVELTLPMAYCGHLEANGAAISASVAALLAVRSGRMPGEAQKQRRHVATSTLRTFRPIN
eukprot:6193117-Pleurochrysis_carterae.AAC.4